MKELLIVLVLLVLIMVFVMPMVADLSQRAAVTDKVKAEVSLTTALADKASAEARKLNAEAHRLENELDRDKIGWTGVMVKESGVGALGSIAFLGLGKHDGKPPASCRGLAVFFCPESAFVTLVNIRLHDADGDEQRHDDPRHQQPADAAFN